MNVSQNEFGGYTIVLTSADISKMILEGLNIEPPKNKNQEQERDPYRGFKTNVRAFWKECRDHFGLIGFYQNDPFFSEMRTKYSIWGISKYVSHAQKMGLIQRTPIAGAKYPYLKFLM